MRISHIARLVSLLILVRHTTIYNYVVYCANGTSNGGKNKPASGGAAGTNPVATNPTTNGPEGAAAAPAKPAAEGGSPGTGSTPASGAAAGTNPAASEVEKALEEDAKIAKAAFKKVEDDQNKLKESDSFKSLVEKLNKLGSGFDADKLKEPIEQALQVQNVDVNVSSGQKKVIITISRESDDVGAQGTAKTQVDNKELLFKVKVKEGNNQSLADTLAKLDQNVLKSLTNLSPTPKPVSTTPTTGTTPASGADGSKSSTTSESSQPKTEETSEGAAAEGGRGGSQPTSRAGTNPPGSGAAAPTPASGGRGQQGGKPAGGK